MERPFFNLANAARFLGNYIVCVNLYRDRNKVTNKGKICYPTPEFTLAIYDTIVDGETLSCDPFHSGEP